MSPQVGQVFVADAPVVEFLVQHVIEQPAVVARHIEGAILLGVGAVDEMEEFQQVAVEFTERIVAIARTVAVSMWL